jgi:hypothetical protein
LEQQSADYAGLEDDGDRSRDADAHERAGRKVGEEKLCGTPGPSADPAHSGLLLGSGTDGRKQLRRRAARGDAQAFVEADCLGHFGPDEIELAGKDGVHGERSFDLRAVAAVQCSGRVPRQQKL